MTRVSGSSDRDAYRGEYQHATDAAYLIKFKNPAPFGEEFIELWLPKSQCVLDIPESKPLKKGEEVTIFIPQWLARTKGLLEGSWKS